ncbi:hypothetical protein FBU30_003300, partial [Linnemannia zychae]
MADSDSDIPTIDAIFVVRFDTRQGNILEWSDSVLGIQLHGVEFSALPSGLHNTSQDVIYFQLDGCIGVAVFKNAPADHEEHRGARMVSVGVLVKPSPDTGRCGQVWRHVEFLKSRAGHHILENSDTTDLSDYFSVHKTPMPIARPSSSSLTKRDSYRAMNRRRISRSFTLSEPVQAIQPGQGGMTDSSEADEIPSSHPSHQFLQLVESFGSSVYILWKAALSRKRILIYTPPPVESSCLAGTTDKLLLFKLHLFDLVVDLSTISESTVVYRSPKEAHPHLSIVQKVDVNYTLEAIEPSLVDHHRYFTLMQQLARYQRRHDWMQKRLIEEVSEAGEDTGALQDMDHLRHSTSRRQASESSGGFKMSDTLGMMLTGGWWWWYGNNDAELEDYEPLLPSKAVVGQTPGIQDGENQRHNGARLQVLQVQAGGSLSTEAIRSFHHLTRTVLSGLSQVIAFKTTSAIFEDATESPLRGVDDETISSLATAHQPLLQLSWQDIQQFGLDPSKESKFIEDLSRIYLNANVRVQSGYGAWLR